MTRRAGWLDFFTSPWVRVAVSAGLLIALAYYVDLAQSARVIAGANPGYVLLALALVTAQMVLGAYRWHMLLGDARHRVSFMRVLKLVFVSGFVGFVTPGGVGVEVTRILGVSGAAGLSGAAASILLERVLALVSLAGLVLLGLLFSPLDSGGSIGAVALLVAAASITIFLLASGTVMKLPAGMAHHPRLSRLNVGVGRFRDHVIAYRGKPGLLAYAMAVAIAYQLLRVACTVASAWAIGIHVPIMDFLVLVPVIFLVTMLPISLGGLGVREAAFVSLFGLSGVSAEAAFTLSILQYLVLVSGTAPGAWLLLVGGIRQEEDGRKLRLR